MKYTTPPFLDRATAPTYDPNADPESGGDPRQKTIENARKTLHDALLNDPDGMSFLAGRGVSPLVTLKTIPIDQPRLHRIASPAGTYKRTALRRCKGSSPGLANDDDRKRYGTKPQGTEMRLNRGDRIAGVDGLQLRESQAWTACNSAGIFSGLEANK